MSTDLQVFVVCMMIITLVNTSFQMKDDLFKRVITMMGLTTLLTITILELWKMV